MKETVIGIAGGLLIAAVWLAGYLWIWEWLA